MSCQQCHQNQSPNLFFCTSCLENDSTIHPILPSNDSSTHNNSADDTQSGAQLDTPTLSESTNGTELRRRLACGNTFSPAPQSLRKTSSKLNKSTTTHHSNHMKIKPSNISVPHYHTHKSNTPSSARTRAATNAHFVTPMGKKAKQHLTNRGFDLVLSVRGDETMAVGQGGNMLGVCLYYVSKDTPYHSL